MTATKTSDAKAKALALAAAQSTDSLILSLRILDDASTPAERMVRAWIIEALEDRYPAASDKVAEAFEAAEARIIAGEDNVPDVDYTAVLIDAIREVR